MFDDSQGFLTRGFLRSIWELDYKAWQGSDEEVALLARLETWARRPDLKERSSEGAFVQTFFVDTWGYQLAGRGVGAGYSAWPGYAVKRAGAGGSTGEADLALGWFGDAPDPVPQALCEFKDIRSDLDAPQPRKGNTRSPVRQCFDYLQGARLGFFGSEPILPWWGIVSDMNEFRLYWWDRGQSSCLRFVIHSRRPLIEPDLTAPTEDARLNRFLFARLFHQDLLLSRGGRPPLLRLIEKQGARAKSLEGEFYADYSALRKRLFNVLRLAHPAYRATPGRLLRLAQKVLDRFIFAFYCEDMGDRMLFPTQLIRELLVRRSKEPLFEENGDTLWFELRRLFGAMNTGGKIGQVDLRCINGGLFDTDPEIDDLSIPNHIFCRAGQGANAASIAQHRDTFLHLCAGYDYAARGDAGQAISLYTLGRIFEQSITELEIEEARLEGRRSVAEVAKRKLPKRKGDGVYFTPEWVVERVVEGALGLWLEDRKAEAGWIDGETPDAAKLADYEARVARVGVVDPACGSGAFLIGAFRLLLRARREIHGLRESMTSGATQAFDEAAAGAAILDHNLYGVDINPAAVEIAKLALWLHSARADAPLSSLDGAVVCGNSLVGPDYDNWTQITAFTPFEREQINVFDWRAAFPRVFDAGGFDVVIGNPPYVKLQNLKQVNPDYADYLLAAREENFYASTQTGNFDLYLPFIEKGLSLLRPGGQMGYIAPSLWTQNAYGEGLRSLVRRGRELRLWIDFKSHQIFNEAITYTALQFYSRSPNAAVEIAPAPNGEPDLANIRWGDPGLALSYERLPHGDPWLMATGEERALIDRLAGSCARLDDRVLTRGIIVGIQTSADSIYHLQRLGDGRYWCKPENQHGYEVPIEDEIMRPLVSGAEAKRYEAPKTNTRILFPYDPDRRGAFHLMEAAYLETRYPQAWAYLRSWEEKLRDREKKERNGDCIRPFDDDEWFRFGRNQNIDKQRLPKLVVAQTVPCMRVCFDEQGESYLNNVRVNGILAREEGDLPYLLGVLNGPISDFVFKRIGKPKAGGWFEANKQFIAPLPVPRASARDRADIGRRAVGLQRLHTARRDVAIAAGERLAALARARRPDRWLWVDLPDPTDLAMEAPGQLRRSRERGEWATARYNEAVDAKLAALQAELDHGGPIEVVFRDGELRLLVGGAPAIRGVFLDAGEGELVLAYWRWLLLGATPTDARTLVDDLRRSPTGADSPAARQFVAKVSELDDALVGIDKAEAAMNERLCDLYGLTPDERYLVEHG